MTIEGITNTEFSAILGKLDGLPYDEATELRGQLSAKYFTYLDKAVQCRKVVSEFRQLAEQVQTCMTGDGVSKDTF